MLIIVYHIKLRKMTLYVFTLWGKKAMWPLTPLLSWDSVHLNPSLILTLWILLIYTSCITCHCVCVLLMSYLCHYLLNRGALYTEHTYKIKIKENSLSRSSLQICTAAQYWRVWGECKCVNEGGSKGERERATKRIQRTEQAVTPGVTLLSITPLFSRRSRCERCAHIDRWEYLKQQPCETSWLIFVGGYQFV